jgi:hypothetical protein
MSTDPNARDQLTAEANRVRSNLLRKVEQLDHRRHDAFDVRLQIERHFLQVAILGGVFVVATAAAVALVVRRITTASERRRRGRWRMAKRVWQDPEIAMGGERASALTELGRFVLLGLLSTALTLPAQRTLNRIAAEDGHGTTK